MARPELPPVSEDLLRHLDATFPEPRPVPSESDRTVWLQMGARSVLHYLKRQREKQLDEARKGKINV